MGDWRLLFLHRDRLRQVSVADVQRVAAAYLKPANRTLALFVPTEKPDRSEIPGVPDVAAMLKDYKGGPAVVAGELFDPAPANIEKRTTRPEAGAVKLALVPKRTRGALGHGAAESAVWQRRDQARPPRRGEPGRLDADARHDEAHAAAAHRRVRPAQGDGERLGWQPGDREHRDDTREPSGGAPSRRGDSAEPAFAESEFERLKQERLANIEQQKSDPQAIAALAMQRHMRPRRPDDIRYVPTFDEQVAETQRRDARGRPPVPSRLLRRLQQRARRRRRLRRGRDPEARHRALRHLEEPAAVRAA